MSRPARAPHPRALLATLALAVSLSACQVAIASSTTTGTGDPLTAAPVPAGLVDALGLDGVGQGPVTWWASDAQVPLPDGAVQPVGTFVGAG